MFKSFIFNMNLKKKVYLIFAIIIAATTMGIAIGVTAFSRVQVGGTAYGMIEENMLVADNIAKIRANLAFIRTSLLTMIIENNQGRQESLRNDIEALTTRLDDLFGIVDTQLKESGHPEAIETIASARDAWAAFKDLQNSRFIPAINSGKIKDAMAIASGAMEARYNVFSTETKKVVDQVRQDVPPKVAAMKRESSIVKLLFIVGGATFVVFYVVVAVFFIKTLITPIVMVSERSAQMATGDFSHAEMHARGKDEIGVMLSNFSTMASKLGGTVTHLQSNIVQLTASSEQLWATAESLVSGATNESEQAKAVTSATLQMSQTIGDVAQNAAQASDAAKQSSHKADDGKKVVENTVERLAAITAAVQEAMQTIEGLSRSSAQIGEIVNLIHTIADQTNLLALNAAIEAARAGDQGRGFAVVADEVRKLADRTTSATKDIEQKISTIQADAEHSLISIRNGNAEVDKGMSLARSASQSLDAIVQSSNHVMDMIARIATATEEQSATSEEITKNMNTISGVIENSTQSANQVQQASHTLTKLSAEIQDKMSWFKTNGSTGA
jgi:methyl-accepting chemotaxis protein